jgi:hypothetical protein
VNSSLGGGGDPRGQSVTAPPQPLKLGLSVDERLDEQKIETLQTWAEGLLRDERSELRAAAKAILLLIEEIEHLHVDLWHARDEESAEIVPDVLDVPDEEPAPTLREALARRLRAAQGRWS